MIRIDENKLLIEISHPGWNYFAPGLIGFWQISRGLFQRSGEVEVIYIIDVSGLPSVQLRYSRTLP
jgi:hypothetical protein